MPKLSEQEIFNSLVNNQSIKFNSINEKIICSLIDKGLPVFKTNGTYVLEHPVIPLSLESITRLLSLSSQNRLDWAQVVFSTESTNVLMRQNLPHQTYALLLSEYQTQGQGRRQRTWQSPVASNIYMTLAFQLQDSKYLNFLPLITAVCVCNSLSKQGIKGLQIKWPNDIYLSGNKLGGILVEGINRSKSTHIICGIGLNVNMRINHKIDQKWTSLHNETGIFFDRNAIIAHLVNELITAFDNTNNFNFKAFLQQWQEYDFLYQKEVVVSEDQGEFMATVTGLAQDGALEVKFIQDNTLKIRKLYAADVSVKPDN